MTRTPPSATSVMRMAGATDQIFCARTPGRVGLTAAPRLNLKMK